MTPIVPGKVAAIIATFPPDEREQAARILGPSGPAADWLAATLTEQGHPISATTIKDYRRRLRQKGAC